MSVKLAELADM